ncbi:MAG: hypothetical protein ACR2RV_24195 [Verrucomicrobiales bacterium]
MRCVFGRDGLAVVALRLVSIISALVAISVGVAGADEKARPEAGNAQAAPASGADDRHRVLVELHPRPVIPAIADLGEGEWGSVQPEVGTEVEIMQSGGVLRKVVRELGLARTTGKGNEKEAVDWLRQYLSVDSDAPRLIEVEVKLPSRDPVKNLSAELLALSVAQNYGKYVEERTRDQVARRLQELQLESRAQAERLKASRAVYLNLLEESKLIDIAALGPEIETPLMREVREGRVKLSDEIAQQLVEERRRCAAAQEAKDEYRLQADLLKQLKIMIGNMDIAARIPMRAITVHE